MPALPSDLPADLPEAILRLALRAGQEIMAVYAEPIDVTTKTDGSPVTLADDRAERLILPGLRALTPEIPIIAEEAHAAGETPKVSGGRFWLVDPLDGTKEFIKRSGEFTVNIALIEQGAPILGVVHAPAIGWNYWVDAAGSAMAEAPDGARRRIQVRQAPAEGLVVTASRSHGDGAELTEFLARFKVAEFRPRGSSLKLCTIAAGEADLYPRFGATSLWDIAAGHAVLAAAGGRVVTMQGAPLTYVPRPDYLNPWFIAAGAGLELPGDDRPG